MRQASLKTSLALAIAAVSSHGLAGGFALNEQSISSMGSAFAGRSSAAEDASTVYGNPAGMARLEREQISGGLAGIYGRSDIDDASANSALGPIQGSNDGNMVPSVAVPLGYYVKPLDDKWAVGFGLYVPFGLVTDYESGFQGRYRGTDSEVQVISLQPTLSYKVNDQLALGLGVTANHIEGKLTNNLPTGTPNDGELKIQGDDWGYGYNLGLLYQFSPQTRLGVAYHSKVDYRLKGDTRIKNALIPGRGAVPYAKFDASLDLTTPEMLDSSLTHQLDPRWTLYAGATWTRWSRLQAITAKNDAPAPLQEVSELQNWHDSWAYALGVSYRLNPQWLLRSGLALDQTPSRNSTRSVRIPTADRQIYSLGAAWSPTADVTLDLAYAYLHEATARVNQQPEAGDPTSQFIGSYSADYRNSAHGFGMQLTYRF